MTGMDQIFNSSNPMFEMVDGFPELKILVKNTASANAKSPKGFMAVCQEGNADAMLVNFSSEKMAYISRISVESMESIFQGYESLHIHSKTEFPKFTVSGDLVNGNCTLANFLKFGISGMRSHYVVHHLSGDRTDNTLENLMLMDCHNHGRFHAQLHRNASTDDVIQAAKQCGDPRLFEFYSRKENHGIFASRTYAECREENWLRFFHTLSYPDQFKLRSALYQKIYGDYYDFTNLWNWIGW